MTVGPSLKNDCLIRAMRRQPVDRTPIWIMRQAGRYLPEYRKVREKAGDFLTLCKTPELAAEVTLQPVKRFDLDAAIIFSDILTIPDAMGLGLKFIEGEGPIFLRPVRTKHAIQKLVIPEPEQHLSYVCQAISYVQAELNGRIPLIGFSGSPWTLACYMMEGGSSQQFTQIRTLLYQEPQTLQLLLEKLTEAVTRYLNAQIRAGVNVVMLFDTWGGLLTTPNYLKYSLAPMKKILAGITKMPSILFTKGGGLWLEAMTESGADALGLDWTINLSMAKKRVGNHVALQGNLDPALLYAAPQTIRQAARALLKDFGPGPGHIFNLGHGIPPDVPEKHVQVLVEAVHAS